MYSYIALFSLFCIIMFYMHLSQTMTFILFLSENLCLLTGTFYSPIYCDNSYIWIYFVTLAVTSTVSSLPGRLCTARGQGVCSRGARTGPPTAVPMALPYGRREARPPCWRFSPQPCTAATGRSLPPAHCSLVRSFIYLIICSFICSFILLLMLSFVYSLIHSFNHPCIHTLIHLFTHSFIHSFFSYNWWRDCYVLGSGSAAG